jgi:hypothetical protein
MSTPTTRRAGLTVSTAGTGSARVAPYFKRNGSATNELMEGSGGSHYIIDQC